MMRSTFLIVISVLFYSSIASADLGLKGKILTDCKSAEVEFSALGEEEKDSFYEYFDRVLSLESIQLNEENGTGDKLLPPLPSSPNSSLNPYLGGEDFLRSFRPTREVDAKMCVLKLALLKPEKSARLIPELFALDSNPLLSAENRYYLRNSLLKIASTNRSNPTEVQQVLTTSLEHLNEKNSWLFIALVIEFGQSSTEFVSTLLIGEDDLSFNIALAALNQIDENGQLTASLINVYHAKLAPKKTQVLISSLSKYKLLSNEGFKIVLNQLTNSDPNNSASLFQLLESALDSSIGEIFKNPSLQSDFSNVLNRFTVENLQQLIEMSCKAGQCDTTLRSLIPSHVQSDAERIKLLSFIALSEVFDESLWKFSEESLSLKPISVKSIALQAISAFPSRKDTAIKILQSSIANLSKFIKNESLEARTELVRSIAKSIIALSPLPVASLSEDLGLEILGLTTSGQNQNLPSQAISALRPLPLNVLISGIKSKSESTKAQALLAIEKAHPLDDRIILKTLEQASELPPPDDEVSALAINTNRILNADRVLESYKDLALVFYEQTLKSQDKKLASKAAFRVLKRRPANTQALKVLDSEYSKLSCRAKVEAAENLNLVKDNKKQILLPSLKTCSEELLRSGDLTLFSTRLFSDSSSSDWSEFTENLPNELTLKGCLAENPKVSKEILIQELKNISKNSLTLGDVSECLVKVRFDAESSKILGDLVVENLALVSEKTTALSLLAAAISLGSINSSENDRFLSSILLQSDGTALGLKLLNANQTNVATVLNSVDADSLTKSGFSSLVCQLHPQLPDLANKIVTLLSESKNESKDEERLNLLKVLSCMDSSSLTNSEILKESLIKLVLSPNANDLPMIQSSSPLYKYILAQSWDSKYVSSKLKSLGSQE